MASITMNVMPWFGVNTSEIDGDEKLVIIDNGKPGTIEVNQLLDKVDDKIDDILGDQIDDHIKDQIEDKLDDALDNIGNLNWNEVL